jgi:outer membrane protein OmpA-like peptidoglycan-associated protein
VGITPLSAANATTPSKFRLALQIGGVWVLVLHFLSASAQNLVPNPGFEEFSSCPGYYSLSQAEFYGNHWRSASLGTPDLFNRCSQGEAAVPSNWAGVSEPYEGNGYAGIYAWMHSVNNYREYLECTLINPLTRDSSYVIEFSYKLSTYSKYAIDRIGVLVTDTLVDVHHDQNIDSIPTLNVIQDSALTVMTGLWETARFEYTAHGGEQYLTIGNFFDNKSTKHYFIKFIPAQQDMLANSAYYYIDNVSVSEKWNISTLSYYLEETPSFCSEEIMKNKTYILDAIEFEFDQFMLKTSSYAQLNNLVSYLHNNPDLNIRLSGHTDDLGNDQYNSVLSLNRAQSVATYLCNHGISKTRIETLGYGKTLPLVAGTDDASRRKNRRVEVKFMEPSHPPGK